MVPVELIGHEISELGQLDGLLPDPVDAQLWPNGDLEAPNLLPPEISFLVRKDLLHEV